MCFPQSNIMQIFIMNFRKNVMISVIPQSFSRPKYRPDIDGMRALAIMSVLLFHAYPSSLSGGFVGVDIFFVISGYLISSIIFRGLSLGSFSFFDFYARRVRRIFPAVTVVILGSFVLGFFLLTPYAFEDLITESPYAAFFVENWRLYVTTGGYWETATELKPFMHFWSLGVEEQYYIFYPLLCYLLWKVNTKHFLIGLICLLFLSLGLCLYDTYHEPVRAFYSLHSRFWELLIGGILAYVELQWPNYKNRIRWKNNSDWFNNILSCIGFILIIYSIIFFSEGEYFPGWRAWFPTVGSVLIIAAGSEAFLNRFIFSNKIIVFVGLISYPLYLWHWPLICIVKNNLAGNQPTGSLMVCLIISSFVLAYLTYALVERKMRSRKATWQMVLCLIVILCVVTLGVKTLVRKSQTMQSILYSGLSVEVQETLKDLPRSQERDLNCEKLFGKGHSVCRSTSANPHILVFGDSHNHIMWKYMYKQKDLPNLYMVGTGGAIIFDKTVRFDERGESGEKKMNLISNVWNVIRTNDEIDTIVLRGFWSTNGANYYSYRYPNLYGRELVVKLWEDLFAELHALNKRVFVVLDNISVDFDPLTKCSKVQRLDIQNKRGTDCIVSYDQIDEGSLWIREFLQKEAKRWDNVSIIDSWQALCDEKGCYLSKEGVPYYRDSNHLSVYGNGKVWELIRDKLN